jgi:acyl carrier protein
MTTEQVFEKITTILTGMGITIKITEDTALIGQSILDSLEFMNYITQVEEGFNLKISDVDIEKYQLGKVSNMINYISENIK